MKHVPLAVLSLLSMSLPALASDLGPPDRYVERAPVVVEHERIIERRYVPTPVYRERRVYVEPEYVEPVYVAPRIYRPYGYAYGYGREWHPGRFYGGRWGHDHRRW